MLVLRLHALVAVLIAIALALALFPWFPVSAEAGGEVLGSLAGVTVAVAFIMFGGVIMSELLSVSGAQERISDWLGRAAHSHDRTVLLLGLGIAPLAESIIGFGVGVIVSVPLLMRSGLSATKSVSIALLGIFVAPWGSLAPGMLIVSGMSGLSVTEVGVWTGLFNLPAQFIMGVAMALIGLGPRRTLRIAAELVSTVLLMWLTLVAVNLWLNPALAGVLASMVGIGTLIAAARLSGRRIPAMDRNTLRAFTPYGVIVVTLLLATLVTTLWDFGEAAAVITSPAVWIMVTVIHTPWILRIPSTSVLYCLRRGTRAWFVVCLITVLFIAFGGLLTANGMTETLALSAAQLGGVFIVLLPAISLLGGYVTASNSATAAMITQGITQTATVLGTNPAAMLGVQNAVTGSAIMLSPARFMLAYSVGRTQAAEASGAEAPHLGRSMRPLVLTAAVILAVYTALTPLVISNL